MYLKKIVWVSLGCCLATILAGSAWPQQRQNAPHPPADIVKDNLDRVAATPEQILEVLNKDSGLMVEFKQLLAQDAGAGGQIMEESDLSDVAIADRLRQDLRTRVLATRLLRRYGYLLPRINPESDLAAERTLVLRERAKEIERTTERRDAVADQPRMERTDACDSPHPEQCPPSQRVLGSSPLQTLPEDEVAAPQEHSADQDPSARPLLRTTEENAPEGSPGDALTASSELDTDLVPPRTQDRTPQTLLTSGRQTNAGSENSSFDHRSSQVAEDALLTPSFSFPEFPPAPREELTTAMNANRSESSNPASGRSYERRAPERSRRETTAAEFEPVRMEHHANPYADVPSLYDLYVQTASPNRKAERFGLEVFRRGAANPDLLPMDLPAGPDYVVGPGDSLSVNLWGGISQRLFRTVDREGRVVLPEAGPVLVSGLTLGNVQEEVQRVLRTQFHNISADVSLLRLRTVRVYVVGDVASPGAYDISSLSTPINALFAAGGVTPLGSLRKLEHYRGQQLVEVVDGYDLLLHGIRGELRHLENGDTLRVPPLGPSVAVDGMVRRPGSYELNKEKNLGEILQLAGGILPAAALGHIEVQRLKAHDKRTMLSLEIKEASDKEALRVALEKFAVQDGDEIHIYSIAPYNSDAVYLDGHVLRPGRYSYRDGMRLTDLLTSYKDLLPEPSGRYAEIIHIRAPDYRPVVESFDLTAAFEHPESAPRLEALDTVRIFGRYDFEPAPEILVTGEVRAPGRYRTSGQQHLRDALYQAGGVTPDAWLDEAQLFREETDGTAKVFSVNLRNALDGGPLDNIVIEPRDRILIHRQPQKVAPSSVSIRGDVARPGRYPLAANMRLSDLIGSAGGLLRSANPDSGDLTHYAPGDETLASLEVSGDRKIDLAAALRHELADDVPLRDGDVLTVPQQTGWKDIGASVTIGGEIAKPGVYGIRPGERLSSLLRRAGGLSPTAFPQAAVFERVSVREMQQQSRQDLIQRLEQESITVKTSLTTTGTEESALQQAATQQRQRVLEALRRAPVSGRLVVHVRQGQKDFENSPDDIELRAGDALQIPKQPGFVLIVGQVYNSNAITYTPRKSARWYLSRAGGATQLANYKAIFIVRADGGVTSGHGEMWSGGVASALIGPGDTIVVPEKTVLGGSGWKNLVAVAQIAQAAALTAAVALP
jgi:protein involved in polysaccharide export with SLBB domain